ncbi:MAG TPA: hypothetical protein VKR58_00080 [Aquella sp.]|nr:hypothetical protein [Aquella sp.]
MSLDIIYGCMYSEKSTRLITFVTKCADIGLNCLYINHSKDIRLTESNDDIVSTHNSTYQKLSPKVKSAKISRLDEIDVSDYHVIGIDEGQFFSGIVPTIRKWVLTLKKKVLIASLDSDFKLQPFGEVHLLIGLCAPGHITKLYAICKKCEPHKMKKAGCTMKITDDNTLIDVGGADKYLPVCLECYQKYNTH